MAYKDKNTGEIVEAIQWNGKVDYELCSFIDGGKNLFMDVSPNGGVDVMIRNCRNASYLVENYFLVKHGENDFSEYNENLFKEKYDEID